MSEWLSSRINTKSYREENSCNVIKGCVAKRLEGEGGKESKGKEENKDKENKGEEKGTEWEGKSEWKKREVKKGKRKKEIIIYNNRLTIDSTIPDRLNWKRKRKNENEEMHGRGKREEGRGKREVLQLHLNKRASVIF